MPAARGPLDLGGTGTESADTQEQEKAGGYAGCNDEEEEKASGNAGSNDDPQCAWVSLWMCGSFVFVLLWSLLCGCLVFAWGD